MSQVPDRDDVLKTLREHERDFRARGLAHLYLHGSVAKGLATPDSDVDLFFDIAPGSPFDLFDLVEVKEFATGILGRKADITTRGGLHPMLKDDIEKSSVAVF